MLAGPDARGRGVAVFVTGLAMWLAARFLGSPGLEVVGDRHRRASPARLVRGQARRAADLGPPASVRRPDQPRLPGDRDARRREPLAVRHLVPPAGGSAPDAARAGGAARDRGIRPGAREQATYTLVPQSRGRYLLGPLVVDVSDPFALSRLRLEFDEREELLVAPEIEDLGAAPDPASGPSFGASRARQLFRTGEEYYTMRSYQEGDDLRRIHWPSVARTGELMIRQDESTRRASGLVFLDTRAAALGRTHTPAFERGVSAAASVGVLLARRGFVLRLGTTELPAAALSEDRFLDALTGISHAEVRSIGPALAHLRAGSSPDTSLVFVSAPPGPRRARRADPRRRRASGRSSPILIYPTDPAAPAAGAAGAARRASQPGPSVPRPSRVGRHRPAPVDEIAGAMAHAAGTSARAHRLIALARRAPPGGRRPRSRSAACSSGRPTTLHLVGAAVAAAVPRGRVRAAEPAAGDGGERRRPRHRDRPDRLPGDHLVRPPHRRHAPSGARRRRAGRRAGEDPAGAGGADRSAPPGRGRLPLGRGVLGPCARVPRREPAPRARPAGGAGGLRRHGARGVRETALRGGVPGGRAPRRVRGRARTRPGMGSRLGLGSARGRRDRRAGAPAASRSPRWARRSSRRSSSRVSDPRARRLRHARRRIASRSTRSSPCRTR